MVIIDHSSQSPSAPHSPRSNGSRCSPPCLRPAAASGAHLSLSDNSLAWPGLDTLLGLTGEQPARLAVTDIFREISISAYWELCSLFEWKTPRGRLARKCVSWWESVITKL